MKRITFRVVLAAVLVLAMTVSSFAGSSSKFSDLKAGAWSEEYTNYVIDKGYMNGLTSTSFGPNSNLTREMFATTLDRVDGGESSYPNAPEVKFQDVVKDSYYEGPVKRGAAKGIIKGQSEISFGVGQYITRQDSAVMIDRYLQYHGVDTSKLGTDIDYKDADQISAYALDSVKRVTALGIYEGDENGNFNPLNNITRVQTAVVVTRIEKKGVEAGIIQTTGAAITTGAITTAAVTTSGGTSTGGGGGGGGTTKITTYTVAASAKTPISGTTTYKLTATYDESATYYVYAENVVNAFFSGSNRQSLSNAAVEVRSKITGKERVFNFTKEGNSKSLYVKVDADGAVTMTTSALSTTGEVVARADRMYNRRTASLWDKMTAAASDIAANRASYDKISKLCSPSALLTGNYTLKDDEDYISMLQQIALESINLVDGVPVAQQQELVSRSKNYITNKCMGITVNTVDIDSNVYQMLASDSAISACTSKVLSGTKTFANISLTVGANCTIQDYDGKSVTFSVPEAAQGDYNFQLTITKGSRVK